MSPPAEGRITSLQLNPGHRQPMRPVDSAVFVGGEGIEGDRHSTSRPERQGYQVLLIESETLVSLALAPGVVKENVTTAGIDLSSLTSGRRLALGDEVVLEISKECDPCSRMDEIRPGLRRHLEGRRGMLASVVRGGTVSVGDTVSVLQAAPAS